MQIYNLYPFFNSKHKPLSHPDLDIDGMLSQLIAMRNTVRIRATDQCFLRLVMPRKGTLHTDADEDAFALPVMLCRRREVFQWCYLI